MKKSHGLFVVAALATALFISSHAGVAHQGPSYLYPNAEKTPGALNAEVTQENLQKTICASNYTAKIRPPASYTTKLKKQQLADGYAYQGDMNTAHYEEDHFISLELGGNPTDEKNLWPQYYNVGDKNSAEAGAREKDKTENFLHAQVCSGALTLKQAQDAIVRDWYAVYISGRDSEGTFVRYYKQSTTDD